MNCHSGYFTEFTSKDSIIALCVPGILCNCSIFLSFLGLVFIFVMVDRIGRKMVQLVAFVGSAIFLTALFICTRR